MRPTHFDIRNPAHAKWMAEAKAGVDRALRSRREAETGRVRKWWNWIWERVGKIDARGGQ